MRQHDARLRLPHDSRHFAQQVHTIRHLQVIDDGRVKGGTEDACSLLPFFETGAGGGRSIHLNRSTVASA